MHAERRFILIVAVAGLALFAASLRFSPPEFRPWEMLKERRGFLFQRNRRVEMDEIGDLGYRTWVRALQHQRHVVFTTDSHGFRNPREIEHPSIVVLGDSYVVGSGVSDDQTVTQRLAARLGVDVYNYGLGIGGTPQLFLADERFQRSPPRLLVYAPVQRNLRPRPIMLAHNRWPEAGQREPLWQMVDQMRDDAVTRLNRDNGLAVGARFAWNGLLDRLFGQPNAIVVEGMRVLVLPIEEQFLDVPVRNREPERVVQSLVYLRKVLAERGIDLLFCPVFEAGTIYADLYPAEARARIQRPSMLDVVITEARNSGVKTVDLRPSFRRNRFPYLYLPDDSHWTPRAIDLAAEAIIRGIRR
jgi:hypothetical protein